MVQSSNSRRQSLSVRICIDATQRRYPLAVEALKQEKILNKKTKLRQVKYLNNLIEQDHRFIKRLVKPGLGFQSFHTACRTIRGYEILNGIRKGQVDSIEKGDILGQNKFINSLFGIAV